MFIYSGYFKVEVIFLITRGEHLEANIFLEGWRSSFPFLFDLASNSIIPNQQL